MIIYQMQSTGRRKVIDWIVGKIFYLLAICFGILIGVVACNWSYFKFDPNVSVNELFTVIASGAIAIYIGSNIQNAISRRQNDHAILSDEIRRLLSYIDQLETWLVSGILPFEESRKFFKKGAMNINACKDIFSEGGICDSQSFDVILDVFNSIKQDALQGSPVNGAISLTITQIDEFERKYHQVRSGLLRLLFDSRKFK